MIVALFALVLGFQVHAAHVLGGDITYECQGGNNYLVTLDLFYDCTGTSALPQTLNYASACGTFSVEIPAPPPVEVSQICAAQIANSTCNGGGLQGVNLYSFQTVVNMPPCAGGWLLSWVSCCRATTVNLVGASGTYLEAELRNDIEPCSDSPDFTENSVPYICVGQQVNYNFGVTDPNGQPMTYSLITARGFADSSTPINYKPPFTSGVPAPGAVLDPVTGQLQFTPGVIGKYVFVVQIDQYDANGVFIGSVMRDIMMIAIACSSQPPNAQGPVQLTGPAGPGDPAAGGSLIIGNNAIEVCSGSPFCFSIVFEDPDAAEVLSLTTQAATLLPGSTVNITGTNPLTATICWTGNVNNSPVNLLLQVTDGACPIVNTTTVAVNITSVTPITGTPDAGTNANVQVCPTATTFDLIDALGGTPNPVGYWTAPDNSLHGPQFDPATDVAGVYTYTVGNACTNVSATVTVSFTTGTPNAGSDGTLNVCSNSAPVPLITGLGGMPDATGAWTRQSTGAAVGANYDPATQAPGVFVYTVPGSGGCASASATVTVTEVAAPNAGTSTSISICANGIAINLRDSLGGIPAAVGTWSGPSAVVGGMYDPASMNPGPYVFTVTGTAPCANATATVTVAEQTPVNAGTSRAINICSNGVAINLRDSLGGTPAAGGTWSGPSAVVGNMYDPASMLPGAYVYTVVGVAPCASATATVTVAEVAPANAGTSRAIDICANGVAVNLIDSLGGTPDAGGAWSGPSAVAGGQYDPVTMLPGAYVYTVVGTSPCGSATATVTVT
ncbi:MAG: hypothetical protein WBG34_06705, partial [Flavobacteriales bacterium]